MLAVLSLPQGIRHSLTPLLLGFSLLLQSSATANASVFVFWLAVDSPAVGTDEPPSAAYFSPALNVVFPGAATSGTVGLSRPTRERSQLDSLTAFHGSLRLSESDGFQYCRNLRRARACASGLQAAWHMTHRWMQSVRAENFRRFANRQYRRDLARQLVHQTCAQAIGVIERIAQSDAGQAELFPDAKFPKVILPTELVVWDLEQRRIARSNRAIVPGCRLATAPGESISAGTLRAAAGALRSLSDKLNVISQRLENAGRTLEFTARLAP